MHTDTKSKICVKLFTKGISARGRVIVGLKDTPVYLSITEAEFAVLDDLSKRDMSVADYLTLHLEGKNGLSFKDAVDFLVRLHLNHFIDRASEGTLDKLKELATPPRDAKFEFVAKLWNKISKVLDVPVIRFDAAHLQLGFKVAGKLLLSYPTFIAVTLISLYWMGSAPSMIQFGKTVIEELSSRPASLLSKASIAFSIALTILSLIQMALLAGAGARLIPRSLNVSTFFCVLRWSVKDDDAFLLPRLTMLQYRCLTLVMPWFLSLGIWNLAEVKSHSHVGGILCLTFAIVGIFELCPFYRSALIRMVEGGLAYLNILEPTGLFLTKSLFRRSYGKSSLNPANQPTNRLPRVWLVAFLALGTTWLIGFSTLFVSSLVLMMHQLWPAMTNLREIVSCISAILIVWTFLSALVFPVAKVMLVVLRNIAAMAYRPWQQIRRRHSIAEAKRGQEIGAPSFLKAIPIFSHFDDQRIRLLSQKLRGVNYRVGEDILKQGDRGEAFFILASGKAKVILERNDGTDEVVDFLNPGDSFGETSLIENVKRTATIRAAVPVKALVLEKKDFDEAFPENSNDRQELTKLIRRAKLVFDSPVLSHLTPNQVRELLRQCESVHYVEGQYLVKEGESGDSVYLIEEGKVKVTQSGKDGVLATLHRGNVIGAISVLRGMRRTASAVAASDVHCLRINKAAFLNICVANIFVAQLVSDLSEAQLALLKAS